MADNAELEDVGTDAEELEESAAIAAPNAAEVDDDLEEGDAGDGDDAPTGNKWANRRSLSEMLEEADEAIKGKPGKQSARPTGTAEDDEDDEDLDDDEDDDDDEDLEEEERSKRNEKATQEKPKTEGAAKARYSVKGADGKAFEFELQPGTSIQFKADGRDVEVKSIDDLVQLAQKGAAFDRKTSEQGQAISRHESTIGTLQEQMATLRQTAEETLMAALFDRDKRQELRKALAPFRDPEFRKGVEAQQELAARKEQEKAGEDATVQAKQAEFWQGVGVEIRKELAAAHAEHLNDGDALEIAKRYHAGYLQTYETKLAELTKSGVAEAEAVAQANQHALSYFNEKNLRRVVRGLNAELAEERTAAGKKKGGKGAPPPKDAKAAEAEAQRHNRRTDKQLTRRSTTPRLQGGGALPGGRAPSAPPRAAKPLTFSQRMERATKSLYATND